MMSNSFKKSLLIFALCATKIAFGNSVKPILPGESLWCIVSRIGECVDEIAENMCICPCDVFIHQTDIPYTITEPGYYCLAETVTFDCDDLNGNNQSAAITIASSDVILDLKGHMINAQESGEYNITFSGAGSNVIIQNGCITNAFVFGIYLDEAFAQFGDIIIHNLTFFDCESDVMITQNEAPYYYCLNDIKSNRSRTGIEVFADNAAVVMKNIFINNTESEGTPGIDFGGNHYTLRSALIADCVITGSKPSPGFDYARGIRGVKTNDVKCLNCCIQGATKGILLEDVNDADVQDCVVALCGIDGCHGIKIQDFENAHVDHCVVKDICGSFVPGFSFTSEEQNGQLRMTNCTAQNIATQGVEINNIENIIVEHCSAQSAGQSNTGDGFEIKNVEGGVISHCISENNSGDGFDLATTVTRVKITDCCAQNNTGIGFKNDAGDSNRLLGNMAFDNLGGDYTGISDATKVLSYAMNGAVAGATRFTNIKS